MKIDDYEVTAVSVGEMLPIIGLASTDSGLFQLKLVALSVTKNGVKLSEEEVRALPFGLYMKKLMPAVVELNGLGEAGNE
jgi:hypothetical protein